MSTSIQSLRERRSVLAKSLHELLEKNTSGWKSEHQATYDQGLTEIDDLDGQIGRISALHERIADGTLHEQALAAAERLERDDKKPMARLVAKWMRGGDRVLTAEEWAGIRATMSTTTGSEGGFAVQTDVAKTIADALKAFGGMREVAEVIQTSQGNSMNWPNSDGTSETGEQIAENVTATDADIVLGTQPLNVYKFSSKVVTVPIELLADANTDIEAFVNGRLVKRIGRITNTKFTTGTGTNEPRGIVTAAASGKVGATGQTLTVVYDDLIDLVHAVDPAYRSSGNCRLMLNDASVKVIRKIKDSQGRPIFLPGYELSAKMPDTILGYPIQVNQDVAVMAANARSILFGDFSYYKIRDVLEASLFRFDDSAYMKKGQVGFLMWSRSGGNMTDVGGAVKYYQNSAT